MRIDAEDLVTGERFTGEAERLTKEGIRELNSFRNASLGGAERDVDRYIDNLEIPGGVEAGKWADARVKLKEMSKAVIRVGEKIIYLGRKLLDCVLYVCKKYPNATIGLIFGAIIGGLISIIPVIGFLIGGLATILAPLIGAVLGYREDLRDKQLKRTIQEAMASFKQLETDNS